MAAVALALALKQPPNVVPRIRLSLELVPHSTPTLVKPLAHAGAAENVFALLAGSVVDVPATVVQVSAVACGLMK